MTNLVISNQTISQHNGFFSLTDLHKASGNENKHKPTYFLQNQQTKELIAEIESENQIAYDTVVGKGKKQGTYACEELVYAYAMWISAKFNLMVIRAFKALNTGAIPCLAKTTPNDRTPLRQAVSMLVGKKGLAYDEAYQMVHQFMGVHHIDEIEPSELPRAIAYVHSLTLDTNTPKYRHDLADLRHQNQKAQTEFDDILILFNQSLDRLADLKIRLDRQDRLIRTFC